MPACNGPAASSSRQESTWTQGEDAGALHNDQPHAVGQHQQRWSLVMLNAAHEDGRVSGTSLAFQLGTAAGRLPASTTAALTQQRAHPQPLTWDQLYLKRL